MNRTINIAFVLIGILTLLSCSSKEECKTFMLSENEAINFAKDLEENFDLLKKSIKNEVAKDSVHRLKKNIHLNLSKKYPVSYDWWLQDGNSIHWFDGESLENQIAMRLDKFDGNANNQNTVQQSIKIYLEKCIKRREERLKEFVKDRPKVVYTKFRPLRPSFFAYTEGLSDARDECNYFPGGELGVLHMNGIWGEEEVIMSDSNGVFRDTDVHFDGENILFSWKKSAKEDDFHLYEYNYSAKKLKQLTFGLGFADIEPIYLPDDNIMFNSTRSGSAVDCWKVEVSNLYLCDRDGHFMRQIGYDQVHTPHPVLMEDGRVVYTRWEYNDRGQVYTQPLFQMNPDGTGQAEYYGLNSFFPTTLTHSAPIPNTRKLMTIATGHHSPQHGKLFTIDIEAGRDNAEGVMMLAPQKKPKVEIIDAYGQYGDQFQYPYPLNENEFLISYSPLGYHVGHPIHFGLYWMNPDGERELLLADENISCNQPILLKERERPFQRASHVDYKKDEGVYYMQNVYAGNGLEGVEKGVVKKLRVVEIEYRTASVGTAFGAGKGGSAHAFTPVGVGNTSWDIKRIYGTVDVYDDGSAFFNVPARKPLYFQALDSNNRVVQTMRSWSTVQPGEVQSCVGCHEHKNSVPLSNHDVSIAMDKGIQSIKPEHSGVRMFSYQKEVQPIWDNNCIKCHNGKKNKFSLKGDLRVVDNQTRRKYSESYLNLTYASKTSQWNDSWQGNAEHPEVNWVSALSEPTLLKPYHAGSNTSNLIKRLENGHANTNLTKEEIEIVALWIDLCVPFIADYKEANNWDKKEHSYYEYYEQKRERAKKDEEKAINEYIEYLDDLK